MQKGKFNNIIFYSLHFFVILFFGQIRIRTCCRWCNVMGDNMFWSLPHYLVVRKIVARTKLYEKVEIARKCYLISILICQSIFSVGNRHIGVWESLQHKAKGCRSEAERGSNSAEPCRNEREGIREGSEWTEDTAHKSPDTGKQFISLFVIERVPWF